MNELERFLQKSVYLVLVCYAKCIGYSKFLELALQLKDGAADEK